MDLNFENKTSHVLFAVQTLTNDKFETSASNMQYNKWGLL